MSTKSNSKASVAGLLVALGIIYGDIGTSPLYVMNAILKGKTVTEELVLGSLSLVIWTLTIQTTLKYVVLTLRADNQGEGGIFSLYALVKGQRKWLVFPAIVGGASLLADGMITPPMSVTSAIEGLRNIESLRDITDYTIVGLVLGIISALFFLQQFGTASIGRLFGPVMSLWFLMLAVLGLVHLADDWAIFKAFNPYYGVRLLITYPQGFWLLGGVFLCTTGAEALYSDLGHCGRDNIRVSWIFVKTCLILNYLGQGAWLLATLNGKPVSADMIQAGFNPFYGIMPAWFLLIGIVIATTAAIIASQALISGSFTLINEAIRLNLWPRMRVKYPSEVRGQLYLPGINLLLFVGCCGIVLYFQKSTNMEAAYGLAITLCMLATTVLFANYLAMQRTSPGLIALFLAVYLVIELSFLMANLDKFPHGGYVAILVGSILFWVMYVWFSARKIKNRYVEFIPLALYVPLLKELSNDLSIAKYATHLIFLTSADNPADIEHRITHSILERKPKRADIYWFLHIDTVDEPYTMEYTVNHIAAEDIIRVDFILGFRVQPRVNVMFRQVVRDLVAAGEVNITSRYESLERRHIIGDFSFIVTEKYLSPDNELPFWERLVMVSYFWLKSISLSEADSFGLDTSNVVVEQFPLVVSPVTNFTLKRVPTS